MTLKPAWLTLAEAEIGIREVPGDGDNPRVIEYHAATTLRATDDSVPWCSAFANFCIQKAGYDGTRSAAARSWLSWGREISPPPLGAIVVLSRGSNPSQGHVGFLVEREGDKVFVLGGNQSDAVNTQPFDVGRVLAFRWPG